MRLNQRRSDERGGMALIVGLLVTLLIGALGLSADIGNVAYRQTQAQHGADLAAIEVATACARNLASSGCMSYQSLATEVAAESITGATVSAAPPGPTAATVGVAKSVATPLLGAIGVAAKNVSATATASWNNYPLEGAPVLPLGVSWCTYANHKAPPGSSGDPSARVNLRTDTVQNLSSALNPVTASTYLLDRTPVSSITQKLLGTQTTETCTSTAGATVTELQGAIWLTGLAGVLGYYVNSAECDVRIRYDTIAYASALASGTIPPTCRDRLGTSIKVGDTILLPVYEPQSQLASSLGIRTKTCATVSTALGLATINDVCAEVPPQIGIRIVGFAPFKVTGWTYPGNSNTDPAASCNELSATIAVRQRLNDLLSPLGLLGSLATTTLNTLVFNVFTNTANLPLNVGCNGVQGYFVQTFTKDPNFSYSTTAPNLGNQAVRLTN